MYENIGWKVYRDGGWTWCDGYHQIVKGGWVEPHRLSIQYFHSLEVLWIPSNWEFVHGGQP